jgi:hypothetical protein
VISPHTPTGSLCVIILFPAMDAGMVSPYTRGASSLNHSKKLAAYVDSPFASVNGLPFSHVISLAISSLFSTWQLCQQFVSFPRCSFTYHQVIPFSQQLGPLTTSLVFERRERGSCGIDGSFCICCVEFGGCTYQFA